MRVQLSDPSLPHQIVIFYAPRTSHGIAVSCNCRRVRHNTRYTHRPIEVRSRWETGEAQQLWREWHMASKFKIKCDQHRMIISPSTGTLPNGRVDVYHERHGARCESQTFTLIEEQVVNRETAVAWLQRPRLQEPE